MDIFATVCEAAGVKTPAEVEALSFLPTLLGRDQAPPQRDLYFVRREGGNTYGGETIEALIRGRWKLLQDSPWAPLELYDLVTDSQETRNVADQERSVFNDLSAALRRHIQRGGETPWQPVVR